MTIDNPTATARILVRKPPSAVFAAFVDPRQMSKFWFTRHDDGLVEGQPSAWAVGTGDDAFSFDVQVKELRAPHKLVIEWVGPDGIPTLVTWLFEATADGHTVLTIEESGFGGSSAARVERALDSTGGFNQVIIAAKALVEHGIEINVVGDHA